MVATRELLIRRIACAREETGLSQAELARSIGVDRSAVSRIETGARGVDSLELARIAEATGRPVDWFLSDDEPPLEELLLAPPCEVADVRAAVEWLAEFARDLRFLRELVPDGGGTLAGRHARSA